MGERPRDAVATRAAILASARGTFAQRGYDGAGLREIAAGAGVTAMMVNRYFGSKEALFAEVLADVMSRPTVMADAVLRDPDPAVAMARALVGLTAPGDVAVEGFQILLRSASSERAAEIGRAEIARHHEANLARALGGPHAEERAAVVFSLVAGFQAMRQMLALPSLADADPETLVALLAPLFRALLAPPQRDLEAP